MADDSEDLDAFLTTLESKLKAPFSGSTELPKAIKTLRNVSPEKYLERIAAVLSRAEKVTQLRVLTGLLGCDPELDNTIQTICRSAQEAPLYEEWVRVVAGLVQNIMFSRDQETHEAGDDDNNGKEANELLEKTCTEILNRVRRLEDATKTIDEDTEYRLGQSDADPTFAPFRYALLNPELLQTVIPDIKQNDHFTVNISADILQIDAALELEKAKEEYEHRNSAGAIAKASTPKQPRAPAPAVEAPDFPGFRKKATNSTQQQQRRAAPKASMFIMPTKQRQLAGAAASTAKSPAAAGTKRPLTNTKVGLKPVQRTVLHQRKKGAAQALLMKGRGRARQRLAANSTSSTAAGAAAAMGASAAVSKSRTTEKSRMKVIDVAEVQNNLEQSKKQQQQQESEKKKTGVKRSKPDTASAAKTGETPKKRSKTNDDDSKKPAAAAAATGALADAALLAYQNAQQQQQQQKSPPPPATSSSKQQDWRELLKEKSNRLSSDDRFRVQQFFVNHYNPTPEVSTYKMKLHEVRKTDPKTGELLFKETFYLELDYNNFTSKQSKKIKRYKDDNGGGGH